MSSNTIYQYHYLYRITNLVEQKHYYGIRTSRNTLPQDDLGKKYFSSSKDKNFINDQKEHPENYRYKVIIVADSRQQVAELEVKLHHKFNVSNNPKFYNRSVQTNIGFGTPGMISTRDDFGNTYQVPVDDQRIATGELYSISKGQVVMRDQIGNCIQVSIDDQRIASGELVGTTKGVRFICNPETQQNTILPIGEEMPCGFEYGRLNVKTLKGGKAIHNPETKKIMFINPNDEIPSGWVVGRLSRSIEKGSIAIHSLELGKTRYIKQSEEIPLGWDIGILPGKYIHNKALGLEKRIPIKDPIPDDWDGGRLRITPSTKCNRWIFNLELKQNKQLKPDETLPIGWLYGMKKSWD